MSANFQSSQFHNWIAATRPKTLSASVGPVAMGTAIANGDGVLHAGGACAALLGALGVQVACNFANDYFDARQGADTRDRLGPVRAVAAGLISANAMLSAAIGVIVIIVAPCVVYLTLRAGWTFAVLGSLSIALAFAYTGSRWSLAYLGLGDLFALLFFGPVAVAGTYAAQATVWTWTPAIAGLGIGLLASALISVNNLRDESTDRLAGKRTCAVRFGLVFARAEYAVCVVGAMIVGVAMAWWTSHWYCASIGLAGCMLIPSVKRILGGTDGRALNRELAATGRAILAYGVFFAIGWSL